MNNRAQQARFRNNIPRSNIRLRWLAGAVALLILLSIAVVVWLWLRPTAPLERIATLIVPGGSAGPLKRHHEPFGVAVDDDANLYFTESLTGTIYRVEAEAYEAGGILREASIIIDGLDTPSAIALDEDGNLLVANTGAHTIVRIDPESKRSSIVAGKDGVSGNSDGTADNARFNGPVGLAVGEDGAIFVADTYNDSIRMVAPDGTVTTIAGGREPGFADGTGGDALFDTPCGIAVAEDGSLIVADTGNHRIRRVESTGQVTTIAGTGESAEVDGAPQSAAFDEPISILINNERSFYVADAAGNAIRLCSFGENPVVTTLAGGEANRWSPGLLDGKLAVARLNRPAGMAFLPDGEIVFAETGNGLVRAAVSEGSTIGAIADPKQSILQAREMRELIEPGWPFDPQQNRRDIAGTLGEIRGERLPDHDAWFHNGLDIPGAYGETVHAILSEKVTRPLAVFGAGGIRERMRLPLFEYIHLRVGRDAGDKPLPGFAIGAITFRRDLSGQINGVRIRRGTQIKAGQAIGTLNRLNHVHLVAGPAGYEFNALAVLKLPGIIDTVAPMIESVRITSEDFEPLASPGETGKMSPQIRLNGRARIIVRAWDQIDGNPRYRKLGLYRLGYRILREDGSPAPGFNAPRYTIVFDRLPSDFEAVKMVYTEGSQSGYQGVTIFDYLVTNQVSGGEAKESFLETGEFAPGEYRLQVLAEDFFGNQGKMDIPITIMR